MVNALWITLIGMSLVFLAILLLWGLMALLVRLTAEKPLAAEKQPAAEILPAAELLAGQESQPVEAAAPDVVVDKLRERRRRAAAAGVAVAMALQQGGREPAAPLMGLNAWQSVQRASQLGQRNGFSRKVR